MKLLHTMDALRWLLLASLSGFWCAPRGTALPASTVWVRLGEGVALHCPLLDDPHTDFSGAHNGSATLSWYRKAAGQRPRLLLTFRAMDRSNLKYGSGVRPDKVSASANGSLLLRYSEHSDSAVYYCGISRGDEQDKA